LIRFNYEELPPGLTVETIYSNFLQYLLDNTKTFFVTRTPNGATVWQQLIDDAEFVIAHPNAWGIREQHVLYERIYRTKSFLESGSFDCQNLGFYHYIHRYFGSFVSF